MGKKNSSNGAIQRASKDVPAPLIDTPAGPAVIQIIDMPSGGLGPVMAGNGGAAAHKPSGINILGAVLRRWWLVLLVAFVIGGSGVLLAGRIVKPTYEASSFVLYHHINTSRDSGPGVASDASDMVRTHIELLTKSDISLIAARSPELQQALPWLKTYNLDSPADQKEVARQLKGICEAVKFRDTELVQIYTERSDGYQAAAIVNAFADAFVRYCSEHVLGRNAIMRRQLEEQFAQQDALLKSLVNEKSDLMLKHDFALQDAKKQNVIQMFNTVEAEKQKAEIQYIAAQTQLEQFLKNMNNESALPAQHQLDRKRRIEEEKAKDSILQGLVAARVTAEGLYLELRGKGMKDEHYDVIMAKARIKESDELILSREAEIAAAIDAKVAEEQKLMVAADADKAQALVTGLKQQIDEYNKRLVSMGEEAKRLAHEQQKVQRLESEIVLVGQRVGKLSEALSGLDIDLKSHPDAVIMVAERAEVPQVPTSDKRVKVQAASLIGGLFLGIFLALLVDKFDKRLRHPRDIEPLLGAPMLGMIPRIQELKRAKGENARSLIAEEFRLIRTQLLFGNPSLQHKTMAICSPQPGDGKTSLAVNLAISLAKAGRRVLLIDADLRKPDIHRIFNVPETPGFAELIQRTSDAAAAIRKTDIELLQVLPAGLPMSRPCELLSRPDVHEVLDELGENYDHIVFDTAPLLPVSDTHVLLGMVDGVICSFNAEVDSDTVKQMEEILRRGRANVIGSVMNQVKYKQSTAYQRGKSAYSSYYSSPRGGGADARAAATAATVAALEHGKA
jgi:capsular exopolysaccharide synthesis family protein